MIRQHPRFYILVCGFIVSVACGSSIAATFTVINTNDSGAGSLRQAILDANANVNTDAINFNIVGDCPHFIAPTTNLPTISNPVVIDGFSQSGSSPNTLSDGDNAARCIVIWGSNVLSVGLNFSGPSNSQLWLQGLAFGAFNNGASALALRISGGTGNLIRGNQFGGVLSASSGNRVLPPSNKNILLTGNSKSTVGGEESAHRNVIASATEVGIEINAFTLLGNTFASEDNRIRGNLIGAHGPQPIAWGNFTGVKIETKLNQLIENTIIYNTQDGVLLDGANATGNSMLYNRIGVRGGNCSGLGCAAGNGGNGLQIAFGPTSNSVFYNTIQNNGGHGVSIRSTTGAASVSNTIGVNSIYNNVGQGTFFELYNGADNDANSTQLAMANRGQNYPVLSQAFGEATGGRLIGSLNTVNGDYVIEIYSSAQPDPNFSRGEGEIFHLGYQFVTVNNAQPGQNGSANFNIPFTGNVNLVGRAITAIAIRWNTTFDSSEFSAPVIYQFRPLFANGFE